MRYSPGAPGSNEALQRDGFGRIRWSIHRDPRLASEYPTGGIARRERILGRFLDEINISIDAVNPPVRPPIRDRGIVDGHCARIGSRHGLLAVGRFFGCHGSRSVLDDGLHPPCQRRFMGFGTKRPYRWSGRVRRRRRTDSDSCKPSRWRDELAERADGGI